MTVYFIYYACKKTGVSPIATIIEPNCLQMYTKPQAGCH